jgi:D-alanyl-D-alanine carboxypeptidase
MPDTNRAVRAVGIVAFVFVLGAAGLASARLHHPRRFTNPEVDAALVVDAASGKVIFARNEAAPRHPASLTKMMTLYLLFESLRAHNVTLQTPLSVSAYAASQPRSHLRLHTGQNIPVDAAIKAIVVCSANDAAVAVAETLGGTEQNFAARMNEKAFALGMTHTVYRNASGLPDDRQVTTAGDLAILARHLVYDFPEYFPYFSTPSMTWRGRDYNTHDMLIGNYPGVDGIKTGYIDASGYNLVTTAVHGRTRLIGVVMGGVTAERRDEAMVNLLDDAFAQTGAPHRSGS